MLKRTTFRLTVLLLPGMVSCGISACSRDVLGFTPFRLENCLPSGGNVRLRPTHYTCSVDYITCLLTWLVYALVPSMDLRTHQGDGGTA